MQIDTLNVDETDKCEASDQKREGGLMSKLIFDATGKYVHPTRYRQIVETASSRQLSSHAQRTISEDQRWREVASKAHEYLERLHGEKKSELEITETCARGLVQAILRLLRIKVVSKLTLSQMMREKRSQKHHSSVSQVSRDKSGRMHLLQERIKGTEKASPLHTLFHR